jgi:hypothetical protein
MNTRKGGNGGRDLRRRCVLSPWCVFFFFSFFCSIIIIIRLLGHTHRSTETMSTTAQRYYWTTIKVQEKDDVSWGVIFFLFFSLFHFANSPFRLSLRLIITAPPPSHSLVRKRDVGWFFFVKSLFSFCSVVLVQNNVCVLNRSECEGICRADNGQITCPLPWLNRPTPI